jgi:predicted Na+-dependent transporter
MIWLTWRQFRTQALSAAAALAVFAILLAATGPHMASPFQWIETAIYLALALALAGYCFGRLGRRLS